MNNSAIDQLYSCAARIIKSLDTDLSQQEMSASCRKDAVAMLYKLANLLLQIGKLREIGRAESGEMVDEDHVIIEEFLQKYKNPVVRRAKQ
jgi:hypothetical protein